MSDLTDKTAMVRLATEDDAEPLARLDREALSGSWTVDSFRDELRKTWAQVWVCTNGHERVVAFVHLWLVADEVQIINVATAPEHRRRGHARAVLSRVLVEVKSRGFVSANLEVRLGNTSAIALYQSLGFVQDAVRQRYYTDGEDAVLMSMRW
jgi:ribosomal-protein-alanine N-acetyltransferase